MTPIYLFDQNQLARDYHQMSVNLKHCDIHYALKANSENEVLVVLEKLGAKFEVASMEEFVKLERLHVSPDRIICGLPIKKLEMIDYLYSRGCTYFVFDTVDEYHKIKKLAPDCIKMMRVNLNDIYKDNINYGISLSEIEQFYRVNGFVHDKFGISFHLSNNTDIAILLLALDKIAFIIEHYGMNIEYINIGGNYRIDASELFYEKLNHKLQSFVIKTRLLAEPGEAIVGRSFKLRFSVVAV